MENHGASGGETQPRIHYFRSSLGHKSNKARTQNAGTILAYAHNQKQIKNKAEGLSPEAPD